MASVLEEEAPVRKYLSGYWKGSTSDLHVVCQSALWVVSVGSNLEVLPLPIFSQ